MIQKQFKFIDYIDYVITYYDLENEEDNYDKGVKDVKDYLYSGDVLVGISAAGGAKYIIGALETAKKVGFQTVGIFDRYNFGQERLKKFSDIYLDENQTLDCLIAMIDNKQRKNVLYTNMITNQAGVLLVVLTSLYAPFGRSFALK